MRIDLVNEYKHYRDHLIPIWNALPEDVRGEDFGLSAAARIPEDRLLLVAGYSDVKTFGRNKVIYVEHGAGQSYKDLNVGAKPFYSGGPQHRNTIGFVCPNQEVADRWLSTYPDTPTAVVGCPRLDPWHRGDRGHCEPRTVAITFHWDAQATGIQETASAFPYYHSHLLDTVVRWKQEGWHVIGHAHPRYPALVHFWNTPEMREAGVEFVESSDGVLDRATVLVADNTSLQAEFLSLGRQVVWLNHPGYRRTVEHGGRFWEWTSFGGLTVQTPQELSRLSLDTVPHATRHPYAFADGYASQRAASFVASILNV